MVDAQARTLALKLGLGDLNAPPPCHGYQHGCDCSACVERAEEVNPAFLRWLEGTDDRVPYPRLVCRPGVVRQPWEVAA